MTQPNSTTGATLLLVPKGQPFIGISNWKGTLGARYDLRLSSDWRAYVLGQYQYSGRFYNTFGPGVTSYSPDVYQTPGRSYVTARVGLVIRNVDVSVFADNLFNNDTLVPAALGGRVSCRNASCSIYGSYYQGISGETYRPRTASRSLMPFDARARAGRSHLSRAKQEGAGPGSPAELWPAATRARKARGQPFKINGL